MLICPERRLILITPPKCGTNTLHAVLPPLGCRIVFGPQFDGNVGEHTTVWEYDVWRDLDSYRFAVATRHPYARALSLYGHYLHYWAAPCLGFEDFLEQIVVASKHAFFNATISSILTRVEDPIDGRRPIRVTEAVRIEHLAADLKKLGFAVSEPLPRVHALPNPGRAAYTPAAKALVDLWARYDFDRFGYARDLNC
jgi:hypothetical protein